MSETKVPISLPRPKCSSTTNSFSRKPCLFVIIIWLGVMIIIQIQSIRNFQPLYSSSTSSWSFLQSWNKLDKGDEGCDIKLKDATSRLSDMVTFHPLKDLRFADVPMSGHTWFMSSLNDTSDGEMSQHIHFPSPSTSNRLLCLHGNDRSNGTRNSYALAWSDSLPFNSTLLPGLTLVSDTYYDHANPWHGLSAVLPLLGWHRFRSCVRPARLVLFHWGEVRTKMGDWVGSVVGSTLGDGMEIDGLDRAGPSCFEEAVVFRHNEGGMAKGNRREVYDMVRCKARRACGVRRREREKEKGSLRVTLFLRGGWKRSFHNDSEVVGIFDRECREVHGCRVRVQGPDNLSFCDQVKLMSETDVLVTQHGAQLTNMFFMDRNSSIMEFFPKGWLELAGVGQYVYRWGADWSGMKHQGQYRDDQDSDEVEESCKVPVNGCFHFYKDAQIRINKTFVSGWAKKVLKEAKEYKLEKDYSDSHVDENTCACG